MVWFCCDRCGEAIKKPKMPGHLQGCRSPSVSCQDCMKVFRGDEYKAHVSCVSEAEKYQGALYKGKKTQGGPNQQKQQQKPTATTTTSTPAPTQTPAETPAKEEPTKQTEEPNAKKRKREENGNENGNSTENNNTDHSLNISIDVEKSIKKLQRKNPKATRDELVGLVHKSVLEQLEGSLKKTIPSIVDSVLKQ